MSTPMTADQFVAQLKKWGVRYVEHDGPGWDQVGPGWRTHNRAGHGDWGPVNGVMLHHTGDDAPDATDLAVLWNGRSDLPGPLVQAGDDDQGVIHLVGCGRANHAGGGDPVVLNAVMSESYGDYPPAPHEHEGSAGAVDGNVHFYGLECMFSGSHAMTAPQYRSAVLYAAAICDFHGWSAKSAIGHKEWSDWKPDPASTDMAAFRADVAAALKAGPGNWPTPPAPTPAPVPAPVPAAPAPVPAPAPLAQEEPMTLIAFEGDPHAYELHAGLLEHVTLQRYNALKAAGVDVQIVVEPVTSGLAKLKRINY